MALILETNTANKNKTWQKVDFTYAADEGFKKSSFDAQFVVPDADDLKEEMEDKTVREVLGTYFSDAKRIKASVGDKEEVAFDDDVKEAILKTSHLVKPLWNTFLEAVNGGKQKN